MYLAVTGVPFLSTRLTVTPVPLPVKFFSGVKVTVPSGLTVYVPSPGITFSVVPSSNVAGTSSSIGTFGLPGLNSGFPVCSLPWMSVVSAGSAVGVTGVTVGVYLAVTGVPFLSTRLTVTPVPLPVNPFSGVKVTVPSGATVYVPSPGTFFSVVPSSNVAGTSSSIGTSGLPGVNVGLPVCSLPWISVVSAGSAVGVTGVTVGVYLAVTGVPFLSTRLTVTPVPLPVNPFSGVKVTVPSGLTVYVPSPGITFSVVPSSNVAGTSSSIGTFGLPGVNVGLPFCSLPWISVVSAGSAVGITGVINGV